MGASASSKWDRFTLTRPPVWAAPCTRGPCAVSFVALAALLTFTWHRSSRGESTEPYEIKEWAAPSWLERLGRPRIGEFHAGIARQQSWS